MKLFTEVLILFKFDNVLFRFVDILLKLDIAVSKFETVELILGYNFRINIIIVIIVAIIINKQKDTQILKIIL